MKTKLFLGLIALALVGCKNGNSDYDASGTFEATEIIISSEVSGTILSFDVEEGAELKAGTVVGMIDSTQLYLKKMQLMYGEKALKSSRPDVNKQLESTKEEIVRLKREKTRVENLFKGDAATQQQVDDVNTQLKVAQARLSALQNSLQTNIGNLDQQTAATQVQIAQIEDQLNKCKITNPIDGTVLKKYAEVFEMATPARPLYKIADMQHIYLHAYASFERLANVKIGQEVTVYADFGKDGLKPYKGKITWISDKSEFTPKTVQTPDERANLVYAIKIAVENDGYLKIGMYGQTKFN